MKVSVTPKPLSGRVAAPPSKSMAHRLLIAAALAQSVGWSKTTTYTVIGKCLNKGVLRRTDPGFLCEALLSREEARAAETGKLIDRFYGGSPDALVASILGSGRLTKEEIDRLRKMIGELS